MRATDSSSRKPTPFRRWVAEMRWLFVLVLLLGACADDGAEALIDAGDAGHSGNAGDAGPIDGATDANPVNTMDAGAEDATVAVDVGRDRIVDLLRRNEVDAICRDLRAQFELLVPADERLRFNCTVTGIFTAAFDDSITTDEELRAACIPIRDMCIEQGTMTDDFVCPIDGDDDCSLTVGEVETCFVAESAATADYFSMISCEEATLAQTTGEGLGDAPLPEECESVYDECPELR